MRLREDHSIILAVSGVFLIAAILNYSALSALALEAGIGSSILASLFPILVDAFIGISVWVTLRNERLGETSRLAWATVIAFTLGSIALNLMHFNAVSATQQQKAVALSITVPVVVFIAAELIKNMVASLRRRGEAQASLDELHAQIDDLKAEAKNHAGATAAARAQLAEEQAQLAAVQAQIEAAAAELALPQAQITQAIQIQALVYAGFSQKRAGEAVGVSENTARKRLELAGELLNGSGLYRSEAS